MCGKEHEAIKYLGVLRVPALYGAESRFTSPNFARFLN